MTAFLAICQDEALASNSVADLSALTSDWSAWSKCENGISYKRGFRSIQEIVYSKDVCCGTSPNHKCTFRSISQLYS